MKSGINRGIIVNAQQYSFWKHKGLGNIGRKFREWISDDYKAVIATLNEADNTLREGVLKSNYYDLTLKESVKKTEQALKRVPKLYVDTYYYAYVTSQIVRSTVESVRVDVNSIRKVGAEQLVHTDVGLDKLEEPKGLKTEAQLKSMFKYFLGDPMERAYKKQVLETSRLAEGLKNQTQLFYADVLKIYNELGVARGKGDVSGWLSAYDRLDSRTVRFEQQIKAAYPVIKRLVDAAKPVKAVEEVATPEVASSLNIVQEVEKSIPKSKEKTEEQIVSDLEGKQTVQKETVEDVAHLPTEKAPSVIQPEQVVSEPEQTSEEKVPEAQPDVVKNIAEKENNPLRIYEITAKVDPAKKDDIVKTVDELLKNWKKYTSDRTRKNIVVDGVEVGFVSNNRLYVNSVKSSTSHFPVPLSKVTELAKIVGIDPSEYLSDEEIEIINSQAEPVLQKTEEPELVVDEEEESPHTLRSPGTEENEPKSEISSDDEVESSVAPLSEPAESEPMAESDFDISGNTYSPLSEGVKNIGEGVGKLQGGFGIEWSEPVSTKLKQLGIDNFSPSDLDLAAGTDDYIRQHVGSIQNVVSGEKTLELKDESGKVVAIISADKIEIPGIITPEGEQLEIELPALAIQTTEEPEVETDTLTTNNEEQVDVGQKISRSSNLTVNKDVWDDKSNFEEVAMKEKDLVNFAPTIGKQLYKNYVKDINQANVLIVFYDKGKIKTDEIEDAEAALSNLLNKEVYFAQLGSLERLKGGLEFANENGGKFAMISWNDGQLFSKKEGEKAESQLPVELVADSVPELTEEQKLVRDNSKIYNELIREETAEDTGVFKATVNEDVFNNPTDVQRVDLTKESLLALDVIKNPNDPGSQELIRSLIENYSLDNNFSKLVILYNEDQLSPEKIPAAKTAVSKFIGDEDLLDSDIYFVSTEDKKKLYSLFIKLSRFQFTMFNWSGGELFTFEGEVPKAKTVKRKKETTASLEELNTSFYKKLEKVASTGNKLAIANMLLEHSETIEKLDPEMSYKLIQQAENIIND